MNTANTILQQLGGNKFIAMTGAKHFVGDEQRRSLAFKIPTGFARNCINHVTVTLDESDTYRVEFRTVCGINSAPVAARTMVYADQLRAVFTDVTGLATSL